MLSSKPTKISLNQVIISVPEQDCLEIIDVDTNKIVEQIQCPKDFNKSWYDATYLAISKELFIYDGNDNIWSLGLDSKKWKILQTDSWRVTGISHSEFAHCPQIFIFQQKLYLIGFQIGKKWDDPERLAFYEFDHKENEFKQEIERNFKIDFQFYNFNDSVSALILNKSHSICLINPMSINFFVKLHLNTTTQVITEERDVFPLISAHNNIACNGAVATRDGAVICFATIGDGKHPFMYVVKENGLCLQECTITPISVQIGYDWADKDYFVTLMDNEQQEMALIQRWCNSDINLNCLLIPLYLLEFIAHWYSNERIYLINTEHFSHCIISVDQIMTALIDLE